MKRQYPDKKSTKFSSILTEPVTIQVMYFSTASKDATVTPSSVAETASQRNSELVQLISAYRHVAR